MTFDPTDPSLPTCDQGGNDGEEHETKDVARNMPDDIAARFAGGRDGFLEFLELLLIPDIDGFGTGILDSISFAAEIELRQVDIKGWVHAP
ncbi:MAG: hypothetical protein H6747_00965 [Deltaproteobacteria bacterium]|nr:hypothetical protein [Deltaproteobacteria bacterium]